MSRINYITELEMFDDYACINGLSGYECLLYTALIRIANKRAVYDAGCGAYEWPDGFMPVNNLELQMRSHMDARSICRVRKKLEERGLIEYTPGDRKNRQPAYRIHYVSMGRIVEKPAEEAEESKEDAFADRSETVCIEGNMCADHPQSIYKEPDCSFIADNLHAKEPQSVRNTTAKHEQSICTTFHDIDNNYNNYNNIININHNRIPKKNFEIQDNNWKYSMRARRAVAQKIVDYLAKENPKIVHNQLYDTVLYGLEEQGIPPDMICKFGMAAVSPSEFNGMIAMALPEKEAVHE